MKSEKKTMRIEEAQIGGACNNPGIFSNSKITTTKFFLK
jgi:hypothetical protein